MKKGIVYDNSKKAFPMIMMIAGIILAVALNVLRQNALALINVLFMCISSAIIILGVLFCKKLYAGFFGGYLASAVGVVLYYALWGADGGFGAFMSGKEGWSSVENTLTSGADNLNFFIRLAGNILIIAPCIIALAALFLAGKKHFEKKGVHFALTSFLSVLLAGTTVLYVFTMNLRSQPNVERMWEGHDDYLKKVDKNTESKPNVLFIMMDDLGWSDISLNGAVYDTPNIDSIGEEGLNFDNFYSSYSVCSPARFSLMTGRYPYRGYADNVIYPTVNTVSPLATTRILNSIEMGNNCDGMLGDEITIAEVFQSAGYNTGAFGKWHLGDYGEYLPTNQGFDYFYGSHHVNDMTPFYYVEEENGEYEIVEGTDSFFKDGAKDQSQASELIHNSITEWITDTVANSDEPFFAYYATPWPHGPVFAGDDFDGETGLGTYVDCITEFDYYLGELFNTLEELGVMDDTIIIFTSDNGPALEGSTGELRGGKYLAYEAGQKVPFMIKWNNNNGLWEAGETREQSAVLADMFPTLMELCSITVNGSAEDILPTDRTIDGVSMIPVLTDDTAIHTEEHPILHMKRGKLKAIQYTMTTEEVLSREEYADYTYPVLTENEYITFKYFRKMQNDNPAFFDKTRKNWLFVLTDDKSESYNRTSTYPTIADELNQKMTDVVTDFKSNQRGINYDYYENL